MLILSWMLLLAAGCEPERELPSRHLRDRLIELRLVSRVDAMLQLQGGWLDIDVEAVNVSGQPLLLRRIGFGGPWDRDRDYFARRAGALTYDEGRDVFVWDPSMNRRFTDAIGGGLLLPGETRRCTVSPRLLQSPSVTLDLRAEYCVFADSADAATRLYVPVGGDFAHVAPETIDALRHAPAALREVVLGRAMTLPVRTVSIPVSFNPRRAALPLATAMQRVGVEALTEGAYLYCQRLQSWVFQKDADCWVAAEDGGYRVSRTELKIFDIADRAEGDIPLRVNDRARFERQCSLPGLTWSAAAPGSATLPSAAFEQLLKEAELNGWSLRAGMLPPVLPVIDVIVR